jgi:PilZ domain-containing protein
MTSDSESNVRPLRRPDPDMGAPGRRWKTDWPAQLTWAAGSCVCTLLDVSSWGAKLRADDVPRGELVSLRIDGIGVIPATVVWRSDGIAGVQFRVQQGWVRRLSMQLFDDVQPARQSGMPQQP